VWGHEGAIIIGFEVYPSKALIYLSSTLKTSALLDFIQLLFIASLQTEIIKIKFSYKLAFVGFSYKNLHTVDI
jgi:hypothetical protein